MPGEEEETVEEKEEEEEEKVDADEVKMEVLEGVRRGGNDDIDLGDADKDEDEPEDDDDTEVGGLEAEKEIQWQKVAYWHSVLHSEIALLNSCQWF